MTKSGPQPVHPEVLAKRPAFAREMYERRIALNLTQREVAQRAGIPPESVAAYEVGAINCGPNSLLKLKRALEWPLTPKEHEQLDQQIERLAEARAEQDELFAYFTPPPAPPKPPRVRRSR